MSDMVMVEVEEVDQIKVLTDRMEQEEAEEEGEEVEGKITITVHLNHTIRSTMMEYHTIHTIQPRHLDVQRK